jgi:hypothetical protein
MILELPTDLHQMIVRPVEILVQLNDQTLEEGRELALHLVGITQFGCGGLRSIKRFIRIKKRKEKKIIIHLQIKWIKKIVIQSLIQNSSYQNFV